MNPATVYTANMAAAMDSLAAVGYFAIWLIASIVVIALVEFVSQLRSAPRLNQQARRTSPPSGASRPALHVPSGHADASRLFAEVVNRHHFTDPDELPEPRPRPSAKPLLRGVVEQGRGHAER